MHTCERVGALAVHLVWLGLLPLLGCANDHGRVGNPGRTTGDLTPPSPINDLVAMVAESTSITLLWTSPGDDGNTGTASRYEVRFAVGYQTAWEAMTVFPTRHVPLSGGSPDTLRVTGLRPGVGYALRIRAADEAQNWASPSNSADEVTRQPGPNDIEDAHWWGGFGPPPFGQGLNGNAHAMLVHDDALIVAGAFTREGTQSFDNIAAWDGEAWSAVGTGLLGHVNALAEYQGDLIAGGRFGTSGGPSTSPCLMRFNGAEWTPFEPTLIGEATVLQAQGDDLYVAGDFPRGNAYDGFAWWNGEEWHSQSLGALGPKVWAMAILDSDLYLGGVLGIAGQDSTIAVSRWTAGQLEPICWYDTYSFYCCDGIFALHAWNGSLLAGGGGLFEPSGFHRVGLFSESGWQPFDFDSGPLEEEVPVVTCFTAWQEKLVAGGYFRLATSPSSSDIVVYDGAAWRALGSGIGDNEGLPPDYFNPEGSPGALAEYHGSLYVGGGFQKAGGKASWNIARWDP